MVNFGAIPMVLLLSGLSIWLLWGVFQLLKYLLFEGLRRTHPSQRGGVRDQARWFTFAILLGVICSTGVVFALRQRPIYGLLSLCFLPWYWQFVSFLWKREQLRRFEKSLLAAWQLLHGLTRSGFSFPSALFQLTQTEIQLGVALKPFLKKYARGEPISRCLDAFYRNVPVPRARRSLFLMSMAYENGLSVVPFLERMIPCLEHELFYEQKRELLMRVTYYQLALAILLPWSLAAALFLVEPTLIIPFQEGWKAIWGVLLVLGIQGAGVWVIGRVARFA